jgi:hypothetical protein
MGDIMNFLDRACNGTGPLRTFRKVQIIASCRNPVPSADDWHEIADLTLNHDFNVGSAVAALAPGFDPKDAVPDGFTVARAIKAALQAKRGTTTRGPHAR